MDLQLTGQEELNCLVPPVHVTEKTGKIFAHEKQDEILVSPHWTSTGFFINSDKI